MNNVKLHTWKLLAFNMNSVGIVTDVYSYINELVPSFPHYLFYLIPYVATSPMSSEDQNLIDFFQMVHVCLLKSCVLYRKFLRIAIENIIEINKTRVIILRIIVCECVFFSLYSSLVYLSLHILL